MLIFTNIRISENILYQNCGFLYKKHLRHAKWKGLFLSLQWVFKYSGFWDTILKKWRCIRDIRCFRFYCVFIWDRLLKVFIVSLFNWLNIKPLCQAFSIFFYWMHTSSYFYHIILD